ncbi:hypothetical protein SDC9_147029 [bioreactor metagenome]|uniref:Uncharacterized protein n=1 Tax=bioreactor metagenome TaxID=1076179 RepID=A0A645ECS1_9ZZZZ
MDRTLAVRQVEICADDMRRRSEKIFNLVEQAALIIKLMFVGTKEIDQNVDPPGDQRQPHAAVSDKKDLKRGVAPFEKIFIKGKYFWKFIYQYDLTLMLLQVLQLELKREIGVQVSFHQNFSVNIDLSQPLPHPII